MRQPMPKDADAPTILILSQGSGETTTSDVMEYLISMGWPPLRLNGSDFDAQANFSITIDAEQALFECEGMNLDLRKVRVVWFRRWSERQPFQGTKFLADARPECYSVSQQATEHLLGELRRIGAFLFFELRDAAWLSHPRTAIPNKLEVLRIAARIGIETPATLVTSSKEHLLRFAKHRSVVTKPIGESEAFHVGQTAHIMYTREVSFDWLNSLPHHFFPSLFQEKISKEYELRVFFIAGTCYASAIFSQMDEQTASDFRMYNHNRPNRIVPYRLDGRTEGQIRQLMDELELETGSLDLIRTPDGRLVFLEVNPIGQFGMISTPCNYHLERQVAEFLIEKARDAGS